MKIRDRIKELRRVKASELIPNPKNWRTHPIAQQDALKGILAEVGFAGAVLARELDDGTLMLIDGHMRAEATTDQEIPVLILDVDEAESDKLLATFDPIAAMAESDAHALDALLRNVDTGSEALQKMLTELADGAGLYQDKEVVEDEVPEPPVDPITKAGDLWVLGDHRVLCGDSTKTEDVGRLMNGENADAVIADPPYGMMLDADYSKIKNATHIPGRKHEKIIGDDIQFDPRPIFNMFHSDEVLMFGADYYAAFLPQGSWLVWDKRVEERYDCIIGSAFELIWSKKKRKREIIRHEYSSWTSRTEDTVNGIKAHPTMKPVKVIAALIVKTEAALIVDPFLGSGTTLIAAEQLGRKCYGMEISPAYCDVIVQRWEKLTGNKATLEVLNG